MSIASDNKTYILEQISKGKLLKEVAAEFNISKQAIWSVLKDDPDYRQAISNQVESLIEEAKDLTWAAREGLDIARAREITKFAFRYAESVHPEKWSPKGNQLQINAQGPLHIRVVSFDVQEKLDVKPAAIEHDQDALEG